MLGREPLGSELDLDAEGWKLSVERRGSVVAIGIILLSMPINPTIRCGGPKETIGRLGFASMRPGDGSAPLFIIDGSTPPK